MFYNTHRNGEKNRRHHFAYLHILIRVLLLIENLICRVHTMFYTHRNGKITDDITLLIYIFLGFLYFFIQFLINFFYCFVPRWGKLFFSKFRRVDCRKVKKSCCKPSSACTVHTVQCSNMCCAAVVYPLPGSSRNSFTMCDYEVYCTVSAIVDCAVT